MADWKEQSLRLWQNLEKRQKYAIIGLASLLFVVILIWSYWWGGRPDNVILFTNLESKDAGEVVARLKELKIPYEIENNGSTVLVSPQNVLQTRLDLAAEGLPRGNKGFEIFEQSKFGVTDFQNKVNLLQAIQGELARTIEQMDEIERARVHIVMPEDSLYKKNEKPATASIMLKLKPNKELTKEQVKGIVNLAAHSVQGLKAENITIVDNYARILNEEMDKEKEAVEFATMTHLELTKKVRSELEKTIQTLLDQALGIGKAATRVSVELNFDQRVTESQTFAPVVDDKGVLRSSQDASENYTGTSAPAQGIPGTTTNIPGYVTTNPNTQSEYEKKEAIRNYEVNETKEKIINAPGSIRRMTVAVLVDSAIPQEQRDSISRTVALAVGINTARGDSIVLESIPFSTEISDKIRQEEENYAQEQQRLFWLKVILVLLAASAIAYFAINYRRRMLLNKEAAELAAANQMQIDLDGLDGVEVEISPQDKERQDQQDVIKQLARSKPEEVAQLVKVWIDEE